MVLGLLACNDRTVAPPIFVVDPPDMADVGVDMPVAGNDRECLGKFEGQGCLLPKGVGVCVNGACQVLACEFGWGDCNNDRLDGCERSTATATDCGECENHCEEGALCQQGELGWTCSAGRLCPRNRYDLDLREDNGCEWLATWMPAENVLWPSMEVTHVALFEGQLSLAGIAEEQLMVIHKGLLVALPEETLGWIPTGLEVDGPDLVVVTADGLIRIGEDIQVVTNVCDDVPVVGAVRGNQGGLVTQTRVDAVVSLDRPFYVTAFANQMMPSETSACAPCALESKCLGTCGEVCEDCTFVSGLCPDFRVLDISQNDEILFVLTARGLIATDLAGQNPQRLESIFEPGVVSGALYSRLASRESEDGIEVVLANEAGRLRFVKRLDGVLQASSPDVSIQADEGLNLAGLSRAGAVFRRGADAVVVRPRDLSSRVVTFNSAGSAGGGIQRFVGMVESTDGIDLVFSGGGLVQRLRLTQDP